MKTLTALAAVATLAACHFTAAQADTRSDPNFDPRTDVVRFSDLDATNDGAAAALYGRIKAAAESVCRDLEPGRMLGLIQPHAQCVRAALGNAVAEINRPALTAYAAAHGVVPETPVKIARNP